MNKLTQQQKNDLRTCGQFISSSLQAVVKSVRPGITTYELDQIAEKQLRIRDCRPSFKNYRVAGVGTYPFSLCVSLNDEVVHGLPSKSRTIKNGDILSLDLGAEYKGVYTDMATTLAVGLVSEEVKKLIRITKLSLERAIAKITFGTKTGDLGYEVEKLARENSLSVVKEYVGHGIGVEPHLPPQIPNFGKPGTGAEILEDTAIAIEPMLTLGDWRTTLDADGWTVRTADGSMAAHFEHTVLIENGKAVVVTLPA